MLVVVILLQLAAPVARLALVINVHEEIAHARWRSPRARRGSVNSAPHRTHIRTQYFSCNSAQGLIFDVSARKVAQSSSARHVLFVASVCTTTLHFHDNLHMFNSKIHKIRQLHTNEVTTANTAICALPSGKISMDALLLTLLLQREPLPVQKRAKPSTQQLHPSGVRIVAGRGPSSSNEPWVVGWTAYQLFP